MSANLFLVRDMEGEVEFDAVKLRKCLEQLEGTSKWRQSSETAVPDVLLFECWFAHGDDITRISVPRDLRYLSIEGIGEASLQAAIKVQQHYGDRIYAVLAESPGYNADLTTVASAEDLRTRLAL